MSGNPPDPNDPNRQGQYPHRQGQYPPRQWNPGQPDNHYPPGQYPPPSEPNDPNRHAQYPPRQWNHGQPDNHYPPGQYPPPSQWNIGPPDNPPTSQYPPPPSQYPFPPTSYPPASYPPASYPPGSYPPPPVPDQHYQPPPHAQYPPPPNMAMHHPVSQDPYRLPPLPSAYRPSEMYAQPPGAPPGPVFTQAAPRQRTAIACSYCRRRKIRCSGFENSHDGRCSNCIRFNQQCLFTPVSSQTQAFVPAHAAYPHLRNSQSRQGQQPVILYGAQGQPLPAHQQPHPAEQTLPPPHGMYTPPVGPMQDPAQRMSGGRGSGAGYDYPDPTNLAPVSPASSAPVNQNHTPSPHYPPPPPNNARTPQQFVPEDGRPSSSPHTSPYPPMHPAQTPPPPSMANSINSTRSGMNVNDMLNPGDHGKDGNPDQQRPSSTDQSEGRSDQNQGRSSTDSDMLNALNRRGLDRK